jgi:hypothetical protein
MLVANRGVCCSCIVWNDTTLGNVIYEVIECIQSIFHWTRPKHGHEEANIASMWSGVSQFVHTFPMLGKLLVAK